VARRTPAKGGRFAKVLGARGDIWGPAPLSLDEAFSTGWTRVEPFGATLRIFFVAPNVAMAFLLPYPTGDSYILSPAARIRPDLRELTRGGQVLISPPGSKGQNARKLALG